MKSMLALLISEYVCPSIWSSEYPVGLLLLLLFRLFPHIRPTSVLWTNEIIENIFLFLLSLLLILLRMLLTLLSELSKENVEYVRRISCLERVALSILLLSNVLFTTKHIIGTSLFFVRNHCESLTQCFECVISLWCMILVRMHFQCHLEISQLTHIITFL